MPKKWKDSDIKLTQRKGKSHVKAGHNQISEISDKEKILKVYRGGVI